MPTSSRALRGVAIAVLIGGPIGCAHEGPPAGAREHTEIDSNTGLIKYWQEGKGGLVVGHPTLKFAVALPYSESWRFTSDDRQALRGNAGPYNVTVEISLRPESPATYLDEWMANVLRGPAANAITSLIQTEGGPLARADLDLASLPGGEKFPGTHQLHLVNARRSGDRLYTVHFSFVGTPAEIQALEPQLRKNVQNFLVHE